MSKRKEAKVDSTGKTAYRWDFYGREAPDEDSGRALVAGHGKATILAGGKFSLGVFQWVPDREGGGLNRAAVTKRVYGLKLYPRPAYARARAIVAKWNGSDGDDDE